MICLEAETEPSAELITERSIESTAATEFTNLKQIG